MKKVLFSAVFSRRNGYERNSMNFLMRSDFKLKLDGLAQA